ncbi:MAG: Formate dehydrogenase chain [Panacagrimonas sp.]|jgi:FdhD protein|nr:formate dehydrogenase accessory sulfurtransferase FdhD [Panacagrimonas sp.]MCC2658263.1 Formate dehydrogenase chain [Panacagrimonas sp.]
MALPAHRDVQVWREPDGASPDRVAEEVPVALRYNGRPHVVMMCTPADLEDFARGFSVTENVVEAVGEIGSIAVTQLVAPEGFEIDVRVPLQRAERLNGRERNLEGRTGCGLCGAREIADAMRPVRRVPAGAKVGLPAIRRALEGLRKLQPLNAATGATHAAAWATPDGLIVAAREDVGRHNALDKLIGRLLFDGRDLSRGFLVITSRASYEMVQKAACVGIGLVVAISAPTALAIRVADEAGLTLIGFARGDRQVVYTCPGRLQRGGRA